MIDYEKDTAEGTVLIDFWAPWCGPCKVMSPIFDKVAEEFKNDGVKVVKVNVDDAMEFAQKHGINAVPTFLILKEGEEAGRFVGSMPEDQFRDKVKQTVAT